MIIWTQEGKPKRGKKIGYFWYFGKKKFTNEKKINRDLRTLVLECEHLTLKDGKILSGKPNEIRQRNEKKKF